MKFLRNVCTFEIVLKILFVEKSELFIENRIKWRATQNSLPNKRVFLFEDLDEKAKETYVSQLNIEQTGKIVLIFTDRKRNWTALGTKMIVGFDGVQLNSVAYDAIKDWIPKKFHELEFASRFKYKFYNKRSQCELLIFDKDENEIVFITRKGSDFFSLCNLVLMLQRLHE